MSIRFGVIGLGRGRSFVRIGRAIQGVEVTSLFDLDADRAVEAAEDIGARPFTNYEDFLNSNIDAVVVASPLAFHAQQSVQALQAGKHVLSEVTACDNIEDAHALVNAVAQSSAIYMMAENSRFLDEIELVKRMNDDGRFGDIYWAEGEYLHDCKDLWFDADGGRTWRGGPRRNVYCTHSLGPILYITGGRVTSVSAMAVPGGKFSSEVTNPTMYSMQMQTNAGTVMRVRVDSTSPRPHQMTYYAVQGTKGAYEAWRGNGDRSKVWLEDTHEPSHVTHDAAKWHDLADFTAQYMPERLNVPEAAQLGGHGTSEYWMLTDFLAAVRGEIEPPIDVHRALDYTIPGILAMESIKTLGTPISVPDSRTFAPHAH